MPLVRTITVVDDCLLVGEAATLQAQLEQAGVTCSSVERGAEVVQALRTNRSAIVILGESTCEPGLLARLRSGFPERTLVAWQASPATARAADLLEAGLVDVLDPSMGERELVARVRNAAERRAPREPQAVELGQLAVDAPHGVALWAGVGLGLTGRERELLQVLAQAAPATVRREDLYRSVWGYAMVRGDRTVDVNVKRLRAKLAAVTDEVAVVTEPGVGYRLELREADVAVTPL